MMNRFSISQQLRHPLLRELLISLLIWLGLVVVVLVLLPSTEVLQPGDRLPLWWSITVPLGLIGAMLLALAPHWVSRSKRLSNVHNRRSRLLFSRLAGWLGLMGISFPLFVLVFEAVKSTVSHYMQR